MSKFHGFLLLNEEVFLQANSMIGKRHYKYEFSFNGFCDALEAAVVKIFKTKIAKLQQLLEPFR